ncbi:glycosyltransferase [Nocardia bovistercoris]|uniref:Glycosyltransferase family 1 protein n=1 Tax=Nocardia bovistercoris TaxID=2785916 RepID=A0A931IGM2_9NOCA|nr:glycosyltransferase [Nocardia bovistercoris]MBH0779313.1 glycosyltransferase family 1 protein [Nocardia bovistercoris]
MSQYLIASVPIHGHVTPLLGIATELTRRGHRVRFLTGARFADAVARTGSEFLALPTEADYDDRVISAVLARERPAGIAGLRYDVAQNFLRPARAQYDALLELTMDDPTQPDAVLVDPTFIGAMLLAGHPRDTRPPVIVAGMLPLPLASTAVPPFGLGFRPWRGPFNRVRNTVLRALVEKVVFGPVQADLDQLHRSVHGRAAEAFVVNWMSEADAIVQLSVPGFEYPRPDATVPIRFAGPVIAPTDGPLPSWWSDLDGARPVVLATQGTIANQDYHDLVRPTIDALATEDVLLVVTTGGRPIEELGELPANVRADRFLPYDKLFPHLDLLVTNGGYGGVHYALANAVPIVIAGDTEDKPEVAARVAWSGTGINLHTGHPSVTAIRRAVRKTLSSPRYREAAAVLAEQIRATRGIDELIDTVAASSTDRGRPGRKTPTRDAS